MATTFLDTSFVDPNAERVSVARIARSMGMAPPVSLRAMIERRDRVRVGPLGGLHRTVLACNGIGQRFAGKDLR